MVVGGGRWWSVVIGGVGEFFFIPEAMLQQLSTARMHPYPPIHPSLSLIINIPTLLKEFLGMNELVLI